jgi:hypothetical protein
MTTATPEYQTVSLDELLGPIMPTFERLSPEAGLQPCDGHASRAVNAVVLVIMPSGKDLVMCGHCARTSFGYEHTKNAPKEDRAKGSDH